MEHAQREASDYMDATCEIVLILILMEHAQRAVEGRKHVRLVFPRFNPYFNGTCSKRVV